MLGVLPVMDRMIIQSMSFKTAIMQPKRQQGSEYNNSARMQEWALLRTTFWKEKKNYKRKRWGWRDGLVVKSVCSSSRDWSLVPRTRIRLLTAASSQLSACTGTLFWFLQALVLMPALTTDTYIYTWKIKINLKKQDLVTSINGIRRSCQENSLSFQIRHRGKMPLVNMKERPLKGTV